MASAINQLIAQSQGPDILGSAMRGLAAADQQKAAAQDREMNQQRISLGQRQMAMADQEYAAKRMEQAQKKIANVAVGIDRLSDPAQKNMFYQQALQEAASRGDDVSQFPQQYDEQAKAILDYHKSQVYGGEILKEELGRKPKDLTTLIGKATPESIAAYEQSGNIADLQEIPEKLTPYQTRMLDLQERQLNQRGSRSDSFKVVNGRLVDLGSGSPVDVTPASAGASSKPLPVPLQKLENEDVKAIQTSSTIQSDLGELKRQIDTGELDLGPVANLASKARNASGMSSPQSRNFATLNSSLERLRNDSLRLNAGVQTDGDAQRAWNELVANLNDPKLVSQRLGEIQKINERGAALRLQAINMRRANNGVAPLEDTGQFEVDAAIGAEPDQSGHKIGDVIEVNGKQYRVIGGDPNDPDVEPL
jgi:hypothetical protein